jgi:hypothetical protein
LEAHDMVQIYIRDRHRFHARQTKQERGQLYGPLHGD